MMETIFVVIVILAFALLYWVGCCNEQTYRDKKRMMDGVWLKLFDEKDPLAPDRCLRGMRAIGEVSYERHWFYRILMIDPGRLYSEDLRRFL